MIWRVAQRFSRPRRQGLAAATGDERVDDHAATVGQRARRLVPQHQRSRPAGIVPEIGVDVGAAYARIGDRHYGLAIAGRRSGPLGEFGRIWSSIDKRAHQTAR